MLKRITTILLITFASCIIVANVVIPHHHHENEICVIVSNCDSENDNHKNESSDHHDNNNNNESYCALSQVFIVPGDNVKQDQSYFLLSCINHQLPYFMAALFIDEEFQTKHFFATDSDLNPLFSYDKHVSISSGLRAPPLF